MHKLSRNERCHCGSGKKYKKCCLQEDQLLEEVQRELVARQEAGETLELLTYEEVAADGTEEIITKLKKLGIPFDQEQFLQDVETFHSAEDISEKWFRDYRLNLTGKEEDYPWIAAWVLWKRLAPSDNLSLEQLDDLLFDGYEYVKEDNPIATCDLFISFWAGLKYRFDPDQKNLSYLEEKYDGSFSVRDYVEDFEMELHEAGLRDDRYFEKRINYCREFLRYFPEEDAFMVHSMRHAIADSYSRLGRHEEAEREFSQLERDYPANPYG